MFKKEGKEKKEKSKDKLITLEKAKIGALLVPVVSSIILLINALKSLIPPYIGHADNTTIVVNKIMSDDNNIGFGLTILGIAVTVWIGLSIYNAIEKKEVEEVKTLYNELKNTITEQKEEVNYMDALLDWYALFNSFNSNNYAINLHSISYKIVTNLSNSEEIIGNNDIKNTIDITVKETLMNTSEFIQNFNELKKICEVYSKVEKIPYHKQFNILLDTLYVILNGNLENINDDVISKFIDNVLNCLLSITIEDMDKLELEIKQLNNTFEELYSPAQEGLENIMHTLERKNLHSKKREVMIFEIITNISKIIKYKA